MSNVAQRTEWMIETKTGASGEWEEDCVRYTLEEALNRVQFWRRNGIQARLANETPEPGLNCGACGRDDGNHDAEYGCFS